MSRFCQLCRKLTIAGSFNNSWTTTYMNIFMSHVMINPHSDTVSTLSPVRINCQQSQIRQLVAVDTVTVSLTFSTPMTLSKAGDFCHKNVAGVSNIILTFGRLCRMRQRRPCRIWLCHHSPVCVAGLTDLQEYNVVLLTDSRRDTEAVSQYRLQTVSCSWSHSSPTSHVQYTTLMPRPPETPPCCSTPLCNAV